MLYAAVSYFNYRKDVSFRIHKLFASQINAECHALDLAIEEYGEDDVMEVDEINAFDNNYCNVYKICGTVFTSLSRDGNQSWVFCVVKIDTPIDTTTDDDE